MVGGVGEELVVVVVEGGEGEGGMVEERREVRRAGGKLKWARVLVEVLEGVRVRYFRRWIMEPDIGLGFWLKN